jgi:hypothetical protein
MRSSVYTIWWDMIMGNFDNCRALLQCLDILMIRIGESELEVSKNAGVTSKLWSEAIGTHAQPDSKSI